MMAASRVENNAVQVAFQRLSAEPDIDGKGLGDFKRLFDAANRAMPRNAPYSDRKKVLQKLHQQLNGLHDTKQAVYAACSVPFDCVPPKPYTARSPYQQQLTFAKVAADFIKPFTEEPELEPYPGSSATPPVSNQSQSDGDGARPASPPLSKPVIQAELDQISLRQDDWRDMEQILGKGIALLARASQPHVSAHEKRAICEAVTESLGNAIAVKQDMVAEVQSPGYRQRTARILTNIDQGYDQNSNWVPPERIPVVRANIVSDMDRHAGLVQTVDIATDLVSIVRKSIDTL